MELTLSYITFKTKVSMFIKHLFFQVYLPMVTSRPITQALSPPPVLCIYAVSCHLIPPKSNDIQIGCRASLYAAVGRGEVGYHAKQIKLSVNRPVVMLKVNI